MGIISRVKEWFRMLFRTDVNSVFHTEAVRSDLMEDAIQKWLELESGRPIWARQGDDIRTVQFSNTVSRQLAVLVTQNIDIKIDESETSLQDALDMYFLRDAQSVIERQIRLGGVMAKWNGAGIDYLPPDRFIVTETDGAKNIIAAIFFSYYARGKKYYTRAEWHRYEETSRRNDQTGETEKIRAYRISNKAFSSDNDTDIGTEVSLKDTKWADIEPETTIVGLERPLFAYLKNPYSNTIDPESPLGVSCFAECLEELRWLDIAISTLGIETEDSKPIMFVDESAFIYAREHGIKMPRFVMGMQKGVAVQDKIDQWQPALQVQNRIDGINFYLNIIAVKCGFDAGYFVFDGQKISMATATQVEASERKTINTVLSYRNQLDRPSANGDGRVGFIHDIAWIINAMMVMNGDIPPGEYGNYTIYADFADITANEAEDRAFDYQLANAGYMAKWQFLVRNLGMTEGEAKKMVADAEAEKAQAQSNLSLFGEE